VECCASINPFIRPCTFSNLPLHLSQSHSKSAIPPTHLRGEEATVSFAGTEIRVCQSPPKAAPQLQTYDRVVGRTRAEPTARPSPLETARPKLAARGTKLQPSFLPPFPRLGHLSPPSHPLFLLISTHHMTLFAPPRHRQRMPNS
jgi:hypothetical protein